MKKSHSAHAGKLANKDPALKEGAAADQVERAVTRIICTLRSGHSAHLPGLGTIEPGKPWTFRPDHNEP